MVERITNPHQPVAVHGVGRLPDGRPGPCGVPQPPRPAPAADHRLRYTVLACLAVVALGVLIGVFR